MVIDEAMSDVGEACAVFSKALTAALFARRYFRAKQGGLQLIMSEGIRWPLCGVNHPTRRNLNEAALDLSCIGKFALGLLWH